MAALVLLGFERLQPRVRRGYCDVEALEQDAIPCCQRTSAPWLPRSATVDIRRRCRLWAQTDFEAARGEVFDALPAGWQEQRGSGGPGEFVRTAGDRVPIVYDLDDPRIFGWLDR